MERIYDSSSFPFQTSVSNRCKIVRGKGDVEKCKGKVLVLFDWPTQEESESGLAVSSEQNKLVHNIFLKSGLDPDSNVYYTYIFKIKPNKFQRVTFDDLKQACSIVCREYDLLKPRVVISFGSYSTTLAVAAHMDSENLSVEKWRNFELYQWKDYSKSNNGDNESWERYKIQQSIGESVEKQQEIFKKNDIKQIESQDDTNFGCNTLSIADRMLYKDNISGLYLLPVNKVKGIRQRIYKSSILHTCWAIALLNPYVAKQSSESILKGWIKDLENIKTDLVRPPPIILKQIEDIKAQDFKKFEKRESKFTDLAERLLPKTYIENGKRLRQKYDNGKKTITFQISSIEYKHNINEFGLFGRNMDNDSIYCRIPHRHSEFINGFFIKYPQCWRQRNGVYKNNSHFSYEKQFDIELFNSKALLKEKTEELRKLLQQKVSKGSFQKKLKEFKIHSSSICTEKILSLCKGDVAPYNWTELDELTNVKLELEMKHTFKAYNTQKKPRIYVNVKYKPFQKLILCCLNEMIASDCEKNQRSIVQSIKTVDDTDNSSKKAKKNITEKIKVYEIDCSDTQRLCLNYGIYVGGWVEINANGYQFVPECDDKGFSVLPKYKKHYKPTYFNGYKTSFCDLELITLSDQIIGHNPNEQLDLKNKQQDLNEILEQIEKDVKHHAEKFQMFMMENYDEKMQIDVDECNQMEIDGIDEEQCQKLNYKRHPKYRKWLKIQKRRKKNIEECLKEIDKKLKDPNISKWSKNVLQRTLIMDIECMTNGKTFPDAKICPIISLVGYIVNIDENLQLFKKFNAKTGKNDIETGLPEQWEEVVYFTIGCLSDEESEKKRQQDIDELGKTKRLQVFSFRTEKEMLRAWLMFRSDRDFDIEVGHNNENFDLPYLMDRIRYLGILEDVPYNCVYGTRKMFEPINIHKVSTFSKAFGAKVQVMIDLHGSSCMDTYTICNREEKYVSYTLNYIAKKLFQTKKADCPYEAIPGTFYNDIQRLLDYNGKDVAITGRIFLFRNSAINSLEFIKLAGCFSQQESYTRGQQFKVLAFIMRSVMNVGNEYPINTPKNVLKDIFKQYEEQQERDRLKEEKYAQSRSSYSTNFSNFLSECPSDEEDDDNYDFFELQSDDDDDDDIAFDMQKMAIKPKRKDAVQSKNRKKTIKIQYEGDTASGNQTIAQEKPDRSFAELNEYVDETVVDQVKKSKRAFKYTTNAQKRKEADKLKPKSKLTKTQQAKLKETLSGCYQITDMFGANKKVIDREKQIQLGKKRLEDNEKKRKRAEIEATDAERLKEAEGPAYKGATCVEPVRGLHLVKREDLLKVYKEEDFERLERVYLIDKKTGELSYIMREEFLQNKDEWIARFIVCYDFASLYPSVCIAMNTAQDKKLTLRKLMKFKFPVQFCNVSTEKWPDKAMAKDDENRENWVFFVKSDYQPPILNRCRDQNDKDFAGIPTESLLELFKYIAYNEEYRFLTQIYEKVLLERGIDLSGIRIASHVVVEKLDVHYTPPNAGNAEYVPEIKKDLDFDLHPHEGEYGKFNQSLDKVLIEYWDDPLNHKYDIDANPSRGILPTYSQSCLAKRAIAKQQAAAAEKGSALQNAYNGAQLGLKVHANSGYGVTGANEDMGKLGDISISATITGYGRRFLEFVKNWFLRGTGKTYKFDYFDLVEKCDKTLVFQFKNNVEFNNFKRVQKNFTKNAGGKSIESFFKPKKIILNQKDGKNNANKHAKNDEKDDKHGSGGDNYGGDTDSFFNTIHGIDYELVRRMGEKPFMKFMQILGDEANAMLPKPVSLQFEKIMAAMLFVNKKRYAYVSFNRKKIIYMGLESKRRDNSQLCRDMQISVLEKMLLDRDINGAIELVREKSKDLLEGRVSMMDLIVTKQYYRTDYKVDTLPHLIVVKKRAHRGDPPVEVGQRIPYVIIIGPKEVKQKSLNAEDPTYALENNLVPDYPYYFEKQVLGPMLRIFSRVPGIDTEENALKVVFSDISRKVFQQKLQKTDALSKFVNKVNDCLLCGEKALQICCQNCFENRCDEVMEKLAGETEQIDLKWRKCIDRCRDCLNQESDDIACENIHCTDFAPRKISGAEKVQKQEQKNQFETLIKNKSLIEW